MHLISASKRRPFVYEVESALNILSFNSIFQGKYTRCDKLFTAKNNVCQCLWTQAIIKNNLDDDDDDD